MSGCQKGRQSRFTHWWRPAKLQAMSGTPVDMSASLSLNGVVLKRLREEKRLTQLYVSKVVGVTTDTISRWENNRYPTMRRDNALKLAEALEVPLAELLRQPPVAEAPAQPVPG